MKEEGPEAYTVDEKTTPGVAIKCCRDCGRLSTDEKVPMCLLCETCYECDKEHKNCKNAPMSAHGGMFDIGDRDGVQNSAFEVRFVFVVPNTFTYNDMREIIRIIGGVIQNWIHLKLNPDSLDSMFKQASQGYLRMKTQPKRGRKFHD